VHREEEYKMIKAIAEIGKYLKENNDIGDIDIIRSLVNKIEGDTIKEILLIDIKDDGTIETNSEEFYKDITTKALFYQAGNGALGAALRVDFYKEEKDAKKQEDQKKKFDKKIKTTIAYCEKEEFYNQVKEIIYKRISENGNKFLVVFLVNGQYAIEIFKEKFFNKMYETNFNFIKGKHICHLCEKNGDGFNTTSYKFYTNDKEVYRNITEKDKSGTVMCKQCLNDVLIGKEYVEKNLTTFWMGKQVMFLPHNFNDTTQGIYESSIIGDKEKKDFLDNISKDEEEVLEELGKGNSETDIIFFDKDGNKTFYIYHTIKSMLPSRFGELAKYLKKYKVKLFNVVKISTAIKVGAKGIETTEKEKLKIVDSIFVGRKIDRSTFFTRAMMLYKYHYVNSKSLKEDYKFMINNIGKCYSFLVDCECLEGGFDVMSKYSDYTELFENNKSYFNSNEKKAWFLMGLSYNNINYRIRKSNSTEDGKLADKTSLDKNFFFARKFDFKDFIYFSNLLSDKMVKYRISVIKLKNMLTDAKELMTERTAKLSSDEAKYVFFWGMDSYFKKDSDVINGENNEEINNGVEEI
jgi:CRISPR-associated protein Csh1